MLSDECLAPKKLAVRRDPLSTSAEAKTILFHDLTEPQLLFALIATLGLISR